MNIQLDKSACKRTAIFSSTLELIKDHGFHGTPMSMIARNACVAAGTIYHYFESKDALITDLYVFVKDRLASYMAGAFDKKGSYEERFLALWVSQCMYYIHHEEVLTFLEQYAHSPYKKLYPDKDSTLFRDTIVDFYRSGIDKGYLKSIDYELLGPVIHGSITAAARFQLSGRYNFTEEGLYEMAGITWDGIRTKD